MDIRINVDGATTDEIERGLAAARAVFSKAGITPEQAADARFAVEGWDIRGFPNDEHPDDDEIQFCSIWDEADQAAADAVCRDWPIARRVQSAEMELDDPEADARRERLFTTMEAIRAASGRVPHS
jgi:hypothetical protein